MVGGRPSSLSSLMQKSLGMQQDLQVPWMEDGLPRRFPALHCLAAHATPYEPYEGRFVRGWIQVFQDRTKEGTFLLARLSKEFPVG